MTSDGESLEARWDSERDALAAVVFCHPDPQQRGTMTAPLMNTVSNRLVEHGFAVLRFNFRGVGQSSGVPGNGSAEVNDVAAAMAAAETEYATVHLAGWSFGAATALRWLEESGKRTVAFAGIAPAPRFLPDPGGLAGRRLMIIVGDRDQVIDAEDLRTFAKRAGAALEVFNGSDHFFHFREVRLADTIASFFAGSSPGP